MIGSILPVFVKKILALVPKCIHASLEIDKQSALVGDDQTLFRRRDVLVERFRGVYIQIGQVREVGQIGQQILLQHGAVDAIHRLHAHRGIEDPVARRHHDVTAILVPDLSIGLHIYRSLALAQVHLVAAHEDHILVPGRDVDAPAVAIVWSTYALAGAAITVKQTVYIDAGDLAATTGTLEGRIRVVEHTLEGVGDVDAGARGAVEGAGEITALVRDALGTLRVLLIDAVARFVRRVRTVC